MIDLILAIIFFGCVFFIGVLVARKMPVLEQISHSLEIKEKKADLPETARIWIFSLLKRHPMLERWLKDFSYTTFLQKFLSRMRILMLKLESKTGSYLEKLRIQAKEKQEAAANDNYWNDLRNLIKNNEGVKRRTVVAAKPTNAVVKKVAQIKSETAKVRKSRRKR